MSVCVCVENGAVLAVPKLHLVGCAVPKFEFHKKLLKLLIASLL